ncbi:hypothetical protein L7F22_048636 [Adiantum nelumboides]|nr:hypothetical protein [Adiantum nelumboides]
MGEPSSSWQNFNFRDDEGSAQGMQALRLLLAKLQEAQANARLKPSVNNLLMTEDLMLTSTQRLPSSVAPMHLEGGEGVPVMHGPMQANVVPHPLQAPLQTDGAKKKQYHGQERHVEKICEEGDFHDDDDEPPSRSRHKKRTNERRTKRSRRNSSGGSSSSSQSGRSSHGRFPKKGHLNHTNKSDFAETSAAVDIESRGAGSSERNIYRGESNYSLESLRLQSDGILEDLENNYDRHIKDCKEKRFSLAQRGWFSGKHWQMLVLAYQTMGVVYAGIGTCPLYVFSAFTLHEPLEEDYYSIFSIVFRPSPLSRLSNTVSSFSGWMIKERVCFPFRFSGTPSGIPLSINPLEI